MIRSALLILPGPDRRLRRPRLRGGQVVHGLALGHVARFSGVLVGAQLDLGRWQVWLLMGETDAP